MGKGQVFKSPMFLYFTKSVWICCFEHTTWEEPIKIRAHIKHSKLQRYMDKLSHSGTTVRYLDLFIYFCVNSLRLPVGAPVTQLGTLLHHREQR